MGRSMACDHAAVGIPRVHLAQQETDYLLAPYTECNGKWLVLTDRYDYSSSGRSMGDFKAHPSQQGAASIRQSRERLPHRPKAGVPGIVQASPFMRLAM